MSAVIDAKRERVWRAVTVPEEIVRWDERILGLVDTSVYYPRIASRVRWRYRLGSVPIILRDSPLEVRAPERFRSAISLGPVRFEQTFTLGEDPDEPDRTCLSLRVAASNFVPVVGGLLDRFAVRRVASEFVDARLQAVRNWCERQP